MQDFNSLTIGKTALHFIDAMNKQSISELLYLLDDDHTFINSQNKVIKGKEAMIRGLLKYFELFPDYCIEATDIFENGSQVAIFGFASGTYKGIFNEDNSNSWKLPSSWKAEIRNEKILLWQVYSDNMIPFNIISKNQFHE